MEMPLLKKLKNVLRVSRTRGYFLALLLILQVLNVLVLKGRN